MSDRLQFGFFPNLYVGLFLLLPLASPFLALAPWHSKAALPWALSALFTLSLTALLPLASRLCSSPTLSYREGLLFVAESMMSGWLQLSLLFVFPALFVAVLASFVVAVCSLPFGDSARASRAFHRTVSFFYSHRLRQ
jgi:hypothetical protein